MLPRRCVLIATGVVAALHATVSNASMTDRLTSRPDGSVIHWTLDRRAGGRRQGILVLAQGSGCRAATENNNITDAKALLPDFAVLTVEKRGVSPHAIAPDPYNGCTRQFYAHHTVTQRALDYELVLRQLEKEPWWNGQLVLFGGSEGAAAISVLAPMMKPSAVVLFSTAPGRNFASGFKRDLPPRVAAQANAVFADVRAHPTSTKLWGGNSYVWWADILRLDTTADMLRVTAPVLMVQGDSDTDAPVEGARAFRDDYRRAHHCNLTYWELPGYDHHMHDAAGVSHLNEVLGRISQWLKVQLTRSASGGACR